jgi:asparagine synthase (glutamine-hydrolysing)
MRTASSTAESFIGRWPGTASFETWFERRADPRIVERASAAVLLHGQCLASDPEVAAGLAIYLRTGNARALADWPGAYSALVIGPDKDLTVVTDPAGQFPVYYASHGGAFLLACDLTVLAKAIGARPDFTALGLYLLGLDNPAILQGRAAVAGVYRVEAHRSLRIDRHGRPTWLDTDIQAHESQSMEECAERLRHLIPRAVSLRLQSRAGASTSADFSGGIDSTSLAFLAAANQSDPVTLVTYHNPSVPVTSDSERALALAYHDRRFFHRFAIPSPSDVPFQRLTEAPLIDTPNTGSTIWPRSRLRLACAGQGSTAIHLTGDGGDLLAAVPPGYLADLARRGSYATLWRHCAVWAQLRNRSTAALVLRAQKVGSLTPQRALLRVAASLVSDWRRADRWEEGIAFWEPPGETVEWFTARARRVLADELRGLAQAADFPAHWDIADFTSRSELATCGALQRQLREIARPLGIEVHSPFLDGDVVRACFVLPGWKRAGDMSAKPLLRKALAGLVPEGVLCRRTKGDYTGELYAGLRQSAPEVRELFQDSRLANMGLVEPGPLLAVLDRAVWGLAVPWPAFTRVLAAELWLRCRYDRPSAIDREPTGDG